MGHPVIYTFEVAQFSKRGFLFTVKGKHEEHGYNTGIMYYVLRKKIGSDEIETTQDNLTASEIIRYLANAAEDGSLLYSEE